MKKTTISVRFEDVKSYFTRLLNDRKRLAKVILILSILILALGIRLHNISKTEQEIEITTDSAVGNKAVEMYVDISGEVKKPGVYLVEDGTRLYEVINKAGGLTNKANTDQINQAGYVEDGEKIVIPSINDEEVILSNNNQSPISKSSSNGLININTASQEELMSITGIGEVIAGRIIEYREKTKFKSIEDIMNVNGIGNATYEKMKSEITV